MLAPRCPGLEREADGGAGGGNQHSPVSEHFPKGPPSFILVSGIFRLQGSFQLGDWPLKSMAAAQPRVQVEDPSPGSKPEAQADSHPGVAILILFTPTALSIFPL